MAATIRFPKDIMARIKHGAEQRGLSINALLTVAALEWLERHPLGPLVTSETVVAVRKSSAKGTTPKTGGNVRRPAGKAGRKAKRRGKW